MCLLFLICCCCWKSPIHVWLFATPWTAAHQASLSITTPRVYSNSCPLSQWCHPVILSLSSPSPPSFNLSQHQSLFKWVSPLHQVAKVWSFSFSISPSNEHPGLISFKMDWVGSPCCPGTLESSLTPQFKTPQLLWLGWDKWIDGFTDFTVTFFNKLCFKFLIISTRAIRT